MTRPCAIPENPASRQLLIGPEQQVTSEWTHLDVPNGSKVFAITGHTHQWGTNIEVTKSTSATDPGTEMYPLGEQFKWDEAPIIYFDQPVEFAPGDGFRFRCSWQNMGSSFVFFGQSANSEMCFLWAYYYPSKGFRLCAEGLFGRQSDG